VNYRNAAVPLTLLCLCSPSAVLLILYSGFAANAFAGQSSAKPAAPSSTPSEVGEQRDAFVCQPKPCHVEFENGQIRVLRVTLDGDRAFPVHDAADALLVCISECHIRLERPNLQIHDLHMDSGETRWIPSYARSEKNLSSEPAELLLVEIKQSQTQSVSPKEITTHHSTRAERQDRATGSGLIE
jgi:hypothetical protein